MQIIFVGLTTFFILLSQEFLSLSFGVTQNSESRLTIINQAINQSILANLKVCNILLVSDLHLRNFSKSTSHLESEFFYSDQLDNLLASYLTEFPHYFVHLKPEAKSHFHMSAQRHTNRCVLTIACMYLANSFLSSNVFDKTILGGYLGPTKQDKDYYLFLTAPEKIRIILSASFPVSRKLKFKLAVPIVPHDDLDSRIIGISKHPFCTQSKQCSVDYKVDFSNNFPGEGFLRQVFPDFTKNGHLHKLLVASPVKYPVYVEIQKVDATMDWICKRGIFKSVLDTLIPYYNFTYKIASSDNGDTGKPVNGTWNGVVGEILYDRADIGVSTSNNLARNKVVSFTTPFMYVWVTFMIGPPKKTYSWKAMFWPFKKELWLSVALSLIMVIMILKIIERVLQATIKNQRLSILELSFTLIGTAVRYPESISARLILIIWLLACLVINTLTWPKLLGYLPFPYFNCSQKASVNWLIVTLTSTHLVLSCPVGIYLPTLSPPRIPS